MLRGSTPQGRLDLGMTNVITNLEFSLRNEKKQTRDDKIRHFFCLLVSNLCLVRSGERS